MLGESAGLIAVALAPARRSGLRVTLVICPKVNIGPGAINAVFPEHLSISSATIAFFRARPRVQDSNCPHCTRRPDLAWIQNKREMFWLRV